MEVSDKRHAPRKKWLCSLNVNKTDTCILIEVQHDASFQRGQVGTATSGTGHNIGPASSFQSGQVGTHPGPDLFTL
jgi:hypothetical protein